MWEPSNRRQAKKCREVQSRVGKFLGSSSIVRLGNSVTTTKEVKYPTQRKYPSSGTSIGSSSIVTERSTVSADCKVKTHTQREYPHGRKLGYSNVNIGDGGAHLRADSMDSVLSKKSSIRESPRYGRENRNPLISSEVDSPTRKTRVLAANSESMKKPLKPIPPPRTYPHGRNQGSSNVSMSFNEKAARDPKPQARTYPHGRNQFTSSVQLSEKEPAQAKATKTRTYSHGGGLGVQSKDTPVVKPRSSRFCRPSLTSSGGKVDPNAVLQRCIDSKREQQQFNSSSVKLSPSKDTMPVKSSKRSMGFSSIASIITAATSKVRRPALTSSRSFANRTHAQTLGFSRIQLG